MTLQEKAREWREKASWHGLVPWTDGMVADFAAEQNRELQQEREKCHETHVREVLEQMQLKDAAEARIRVLEEALRRYGKHELTCAIPSYGYGNPWFDKECTCGFAALAGAPPQAERKGK